ncbi:MAG TPA: hypothetical protein VGK66_03870 [Solirubrobacterales bacterium]
MLLVLVVVNSLLNTSGGESPFNPNPVAEAAERTQEVDGLRFAMKVRATSEAHPPEIDRGSGAFDLQTKLGVIHYDGWTADDTRVKVDMVIGEDAVYLRSPELRGKLPGGKEWAEMDPSLLSDEDSVPAENPDSSLGMLSASERVHLAGHSKVRGVPVSRYVATFEMGEVIAELRAQGEDELAEDCEKLAANVVGPVHAEAFVDGKGLVRRIRIHMGSTASGTPETIDSTMDFFAFNSHPAIQVPPERLVYDMTPLMEEQQEALGQPN